MTEINSTIHERLNEFATGWLQAEPASLPMCGTILPAAACLWANHRALRMTDRGELGAADPITTLIERTAVVLGSKERGQPATIWVDRYGGYGIASNGGSGRAGYVNGYHVKGIGRTGLIGTDANLHHSNGGAFLEEAIREAAFSEIASAELPYGAIPLLAIIDTGRVRQWDDVADDAATASREREVLMVRPMLLRPAHLERAALFRASSPVATMMDRLRVDGVVAGLSKSFGSDALLTVIARFVRRWARQLAYGFVHRLAHGGICTSNVAIDGALFDFGASSAVPTWAQWVSIPGEPPLGRELFQLGSILPSLIRDICLRLGYDFETIYRNIWSSAVTSYDDTVMLEVCRLAGATRRTIVEKLADRGRRNLAMRAVRRVIAYHQRELGDFVDGVRDHALTWQFGEIWNDVPPAWLRPMRDVLEILVSEDRAAAIERCRFRSRTRVDLFREELRRRIHRDLAGNITDPAWDAGSVTRLITGLIATGRRDSKFDEPGTAQIGNFIGHQRSYTLHRRGICKDVFAVEDGSCQPIAIRAIGQDSLSLTTQDMPIIGSCYLP